jgi:DNA-binding transcriptional LysR family regulator
MSLDELETFLTIARVGGFGRAAQVLHRSQPAISRRIEMLEAELRTPLFERVRGGMLLTEAGRELLPYAERALAAVKDGADAVRSLERGARGSVSLVLVGTLASTALADKLRAFRADNPAIRLALRTARSAEVSDIVRRGEATIGLRYFADPDTGFVCEQVGAEALAVICAPDHPLAGRRLRDAKKLAGERWVAFAPSRERRETFATVVDERMRAAGLGAVETVHIDSLTAQKRFVEAGFGLALVVESAIEEERRSGALGVIDVPALKGKFPVVLVRRRDGYLGGAARALCRALGARLG